MPVSTMTQPILSIQAAVPSPSPPTGNANNTNILPASPSIFLSTASPDFNIPSIELSPVDHNIEDLKVCLIRFVVFWKLKLLL